MDCHNTVKTPISFQTSDWTVQNSVMLHDLIIMSGFPHTLSGDELKAKLPEKHQKGIEKVDELWLLFCSSFCDYRISSDIRQSFFPSKITPKM